MPSLFSAAKAVAHHVSTAASRAQVELQLTSPRGGRASFRHIVAISSSIAHLPDEHAAVSGAMRSSVRFEGCPPRIPQQYGEVHLRQRTAARPCASYQAFHVLHFHKRARYALAKAVESPRSRQAFRCWWQKENDA